MSITLRHLTDEELIAAIASLTGQARAVTAALVAHLAELEARDLHHAQGYRSLYAYCRGVLHLSEHEAYHRMEAARAARRFPVLLAMLAEGRLHLTAVCLLAPRLKNEDHLALIGGAIRKSKADVEMLLARWFPRLDVKTSIRRAPRGAGARAGTVAAASGAASSADVSSTETPSTEASSTEASSTEAAGAGASNSDASDTTSSAAHGRTPAPLKAPSPVIVGATGPRPSGHPDRSEGADDGCPGSPAPVPPRRPRSSIAPLSAEAFDVRFRARAETVSRLRRAQELLSHAVPDGDVDEILYRALGELIAQAEKQRHAGHVGAGGTGGRRSRGVAPASRDISADVQREVWARDGGQCAFVAKTGHRCEERRFLEFHHVKPWAASGPPTVANISLRCRAHNDYEARVYFGPIRRARAEREANEDPASLREPASKERPAVTRSGPSHELPPATAG